jgi:hypothetical protein
MYIRKRNVCNPAFHARSPWWLSFYFPFPILKYFRGHIQVTDSSLSRSLRFSLSAGLPAVLCALLLAPFPPLWKMLATLSLACLSLFTSPFLSLFISIGKALFIPSYIVYIIYRWCNLSILRERSCCSKTAAFRAFTFRNA